MKKVRTIFIVATCIALASQVSINLFANGFIVALSVIILPVLLYFNREFNPIKLTCIVGIVSPVYRGIMLYISNTGFNQVVNLVATDMLFYFIYGIIYYFLYWQKTNANLTNFFASIFTCDFLSNVLEVSVLLDFKDKYYIFQDLAIIAFVRSTIAVCVIMLFKYYSSLLIREEHEERYRKLIFITSKLKSEVYFMNKNITGIEEVMKKAYYLYKALSDNNYPVEFKNTSLAIAKDVHEIKKDYISVIRGLEDTFDEKNDNVKMDIKDITIIIEADAKEYIRRNKLEIFLDFKIYDDFMVEKHYYLVSVLRNLIYNSIEAIGKRKNGYIRVVINKSKDDYVFTVSDNGQGIKSENIDYIFNPGFTTKFNEETGDICRGIGLSHVKGIINDVFLGSISVNSQEGKGAEFIIKINKDKLEGDAN
ncbi:ATP-binding protein [Clostridium sp. JN-9]|uniref:ATP-binding protein n=1 Tax=Clostridium sp. JN-9 TaxID=2507159 RepID=UPI000FFE1161|nr:ATP-binding protein [Clostridium sp. JN-9]QAT39345.1 GHKL domain-containing protein [Clostridium sp. JN-9]